MFADNFAQGRLRTLIRWKLPLIVGVSAGLLVSSAAQATTNPGLGTSKLELRDASDKPETLVYTDARGGAMRMESVEQQRIIVTRVDGKPAADEGRGAAKGTALAIKATSPNSYTLTFFIAGKPYVQGTNMRTPDGKTFPEVSWLVKKPADTPTLVDPRQ